MFYQGGPIDHCTHVPGPVSQYSAKSEYNIAYTSGVALAYFRMLNNEFMNKYPDLVPEHAPIIILDRKSTVYMDNNVKDTKHTRQISKIMHFVINVEECNLHNIVWCKGGLKLADIGIKNVGEDELSNILGYNMVRLENL